MIVTRNWLQEFVDIAKISTEKICIALNSIGLEVDSVEKIRIAKGVQIGYVEAKEKHPDADKLNICQVKLGDETVQIVCGAKNVDAGQYVPVATIGTTLGEDFKIKKSKLRGVESNGMICSSSEIGLPKTNDGILVLDDSIGELELGKELNEYPLINDDVITIELTANRGDCLNIKAIAKELGVYFNLPVFECETKIVEDDRAIGRVLDIEYSNDVDASLIYKVTDITKLTLPLLVDLRNAIVEAPRKTNIETLCAYATHSVGVLFNAYVESIAKQEEEKLKLKIYKDTNGFTHVDGNIPLSTVGINHGAIETTAETIVLEASYCEPTTLAQNVFTSKIDTAEVYYKSSRGSNPNLDNGIQYLTTILSQYGATIYRGQIDFINEIEEKIIDVNYERINEIIGYKIEKKEIEHILSSLGFIQNKINEHSVSWKVPATRHDIVNIADITEEVVRIVGIDNIPASPLAMEEANRTNQISDKLLVKNALRTKAIGNGFFETNTYLFTSKETLEKYGFDVVKEELDILNPITNDLNTFRTTVLVNLIQGVSANTKQGFKSQALYELGSVYDKERNESKKVSFIVSGKVEEESLQNQGKPVDYDFYSFAQKLSNVIGNFELETKTDGNTTFLHPYQAANIVINGKMIGFISKVHPTITKELDISDATFVAEIAFDLLENELIHANDISKYQNVKRDLSIVVPKSLEYKNIKTVINALQIKELVQYNLIDIYSDDSLEDKESITINFILQSYDKTLEEEDITSIMDTILESLKDKVGAQLR
jgi:phenylalanyl-tRNA synthetase beta chain